LLLAAPSDGDEKPKPMLPLPFVGNVNLTEQHLIWACLDAYYWKPGKGDKKKEKEFNGPIRNAVRLLIESDAQVHRSIALALSIVAIDALLGRGNEEIITNGGQRIARLFEPDPSKRGNAKKFFKRVYGNRSAVLHGRELETPPNIQREARHLAASVLHAIVQIKRFRQSTGIPIARDKLLTELCGDFDSSKQGFPDGLLEYTVRKYWMRDEKRGLG